MSMSERRRRRARHGAGALIVLAALATAALAAPPSAYASLPGFKTVASSTAWVDFNGDGRTDFCRVASDSRLRCTVTTGSGFGTVVTSGAVDAGYAAGRAWTDFNGDGRADYCRVVGVWDKNLACTVANGSGTGFGTTYTSGSQDAGYDAGRAWTDITGDGRADYCRVIGSGNQVRCTPSTGGGFGGYFTAAISDAGYNAGRAWTDFDGDGRTDYCRVIGTGSKYLRCTVSTGNGLGATFTSGPQDPGYDAGRAWTDVNDDGMADYCRRVGWGDQVQCTPSNHKSFGATFTSTPMTDPGYDWSGAWADFNGDGRDDYCRQMDGPGARCLLSTGSNFGANPGYLGPAGATGNTGWVDVNLDGRADYCRVTSTGYGYCTTSTGTGFGTTFSGSVGSV